MDIMNLAVNTAVIGAIIAVSEVFKSLDTFGKLTRYYIIIPTVLGILAALALSNPFQWQEIIKQSIIYVGLSTYLFKFGKTTLFGK